jgi:hypothetical protein
MRIDAAARIVERDAGEQLHACFGEELLEDHGVRDAEIEMILVEQRPEPGVGAVHQRFVMVENARHRGRAGMAVQVDCADQQGRHFGVAVIGIRGHRGLLFF